MGYAEAHNPQVLAHYEGLIFSTARMLKGHVEEEQEDVQQILRIKAFRALLSYNPGRMRGVDIPCASVPACRCPRCRFVFMCVRDQAKDLAKRRRRGELHIEELVRTSDSSGLESRDWFDDRYLSTTHEQVYGTVEDDGAMLPNTLSSEEREIVLMLYREHRQTEIARTLGLGKREMEKAMRSVREKLADWRPVAPARLLPEPDAPVAQAA